LTLMLRKLPAASRSSTKNNASPLPPGPLPSGRASVSVTSDVTAEVNHFVP
jgi:hypothetical protein